MKNATLCFLIRGDEVCLGMKKVRFGAGKWNGFGGKVGDIEEHKNETPEETIRRESVEEFSVELKNLEKVAEIVFNFPHDESWDHNVHVFICKDWTGEPQESEEMRPEWFKISEIPYNQMWNDDQYWLPLVLEGKKLNASFVFDKEGNVIDQKIEII